MTLQIDTAAKVVRRFAEEHDIVMTNRQCLYLATMAVNFGSAQAQVAGDMLVKNDGLEITEGQVISIVKLIDAEPDQTGPFVSTR